MRKRKLSLNELVQKNISNIWQDEDALSNIDSVLDRKLTQNTGQGKNKTRRRGFKEI
ncbi:MULTISPECIES: FbpB family small basic protein [unclassified Sporolactobacillus]|uniref:FbpB family small basic protein n=1 Tax=unclassified Sporolactobacillus TaxID=2628533 RepID=UPI002368948A|nr:FbpB family small basic protein [Sporolactobacillus sp. CQH2019]MDD9147484.1 FbpB family small basic protein [Sporolactobacillus sp. CQH2019]